ncbi:MULTISPECIES: hypothetical protein [unclassified Corynebacterium]|uniref:hypothetical protein n=1 Tax=unclassified Corynebacterium TaxID=2624378 RepID=UPI00264E8D07|nr:MULTISPECIES: hypothetical protein [unclassified Corynebacterium]MDN8595549.1 hypothetical protein [Corynebacterium sp. P4_F2]WKK56412.1 hypothetical protein QYR03_04160 [Corynebacterium sp. P4-C1]WKK63845.1 hypothetical protein QYR04_02770 [Corynebacterium sp. P8-C1]
MGRVAADHPPRSTMIFLGVVVFRDNQNTVFFPTAPEYGNLIHAEHTLAEPPIAVAAVLTAVTLVACSSGDGETPSPSGAPSSSTH